MKKALIFVSLLLISTFFVGCDFSDFFVTKSTTSQQTLESTDSSTISTDLSTTLTDIITDTEKTYETTKTEEVTTEVTTTEVTTETSTTTEEVNPYERYQVINLFSMNDFHGGAYSNIDNLEQIGAYLINQKSLNENTIILSNGDIFQGSALSNYYKGLPIVDVFNEVGFDGFILGNHEFDWGIEEILKYRDGQIENGEMEFPILAANIVYKDTQLPLENTVPYIIKEVSGVKVGVIGLVGNVINSIAASRVENIEFKDPEDTAYHYARELRADEGCDIVVVYIHGSSGNNDEYAYFTGDYRIDAVFNGHTHSSESSKITRSSNYAPLFYAQASNYESSLFVGITIEYDTELDKVVYSTSYTNNTKATVYDYSDVSSYSNSNIAGILEDYRTRTDYVNTIYEILAVSNQTYNRYDLAPWGASVIRDYAGVDIGAVNSGGFRVDINPGNITYETMIEVYPFDNTIKTAEFTGSELYTLYDSISGDVIWDDGFYKSGGTIYVNGQPVVSNQVYTVGAVDYIFDKTNYGFLDGSNIQNSGLFMRDLLLDDLRNIPEGTYFNPDNGTSYQDLFTIYDPNHYKEILISTSF